MISKSNTANRPNPPLAKRYKQEIIKLEEDVVDAKNKADGLLWDVKTKQAKKDNLELPLTKAIGEMKKLLDDFDRQVTLALKKQWGAGDWFRSLPVIDGFAAPTKIKQYTINDIHHRLQLQRRDPFRPLHHLPPGHR